MTHDRCYGCMMPLQEQTCPLCGWKEEDRNGAHQLQPGTELAGRYLLGRALGQGGYGITYLGWDQLEERTVCIKEFYPSGIANRDTEVSPQINCNTSQQEPIFDAGKARFLREAQALSIFRETPQIVTLYDTLEENGTAYMIMEFVRGSNLHQYMSRRKAPLTMDETLKILRPVADALTEIHKAELVHRDIAPDNIILHPMEGAKLLDFGAIRLVEAADVSKELDKSTEMILKNGFAPLEQYASKGSLGPWTDVYAFSATIYYCLTKRIPDNAPIRLLEGDALDWSGTVGVSPEQKQALEKGLAVRASDRTASVRELMSQLQAQSSPEEPQEEARPATAPTEGPSTARGPEALPTGRTKRQTRLKARPRTLAAILILLLVLGGLAGTYLVTVFMAGQAAADGAFRKADRLLVFPAVTELHDPMLVSYVRAGMLLEQGDYDSAKQTFLALGEYQEAPLLAHGCDLKKAEALIGQGSYADALLILSPLEKQGDSEAIQLSQEAHLLWARKLADEGDYPSAFYQLSLCTEHPDTQSAMDTLKVKAYSEAQLLYVNGRFSEATRLFTVLQGYKDTNDYLLLINCVACSNFATADVLIEPLFDILGFEDSAELLMCNTYIGCYALAGEWVNSSGKTLLNMEKSSSDEFSLNWDLPYPDVLSTHFSIEKGTVLLWLEEGGSTPLFDICFLDRDTLEVYCHEDSSTHILHRK